MLSINNNIAALASHNDLNSANNMMTKSISRLSSGLRINSAADDPSGLSISERMRTQIRGISRAEENAQSAISLIQTAEGALNEAHSILHRMRELAIQASNGTLTADDRLEVQHEVESLIKEVDAIAKRTEFNTKRLLTGESSALWSSSTSDIKALVRGQVEDGSYSLEIHSQPGVPQVMQTSVFRIKDGVKGVRELELNGIQSEMNGDITPTAAPGNIDLTFNFGNGDIEFNYSTTGTTAVDNGRELVDAINADSRLNDSIIASYDPTGNVSITAREAGVAGNGFRVAVAGLGVDPLDVGDHTFSGGVESRAGISGLADTEGLIPTSSLDVSYEINVDENADSTLQAGAEDVYGLVGQYLQDGSNGLANSYMVGDITATAVNGPVEITFNFGGDDITVNVTTTTGTIIGNAGEIAAAINGNSDVNTYVEAIDDGAGNITINMLDPSTPGDYTITLEGGVDSADLGPHTFNVGTGLMNGDITATSHNSTNQFTFDLGGGPINFPITTTAGTAEGNAQQITDAINSDPVLSADIVASHDGNGNVQITALVPGASGAYTVTVGAGTTDAVDQGYHAITNNLGALGALDTDAFTLNSDSATGGYAIIEFTSDGALGAPGLDARVSFDQGDTWYSADDIWNGATDVLITDGSYTLEFNQAFTNGGDGANFQVGDRMLLALNDNNNSPGRDLTRVDAFDPSNNLEQIGAVYSFTDGVLDDRTTELQTGWINTETGHIEFGTVNTTFNQNTTGQGISDGTVTFNVINGGGDASGHTRLIDVDRFYDADGNFILGEHGEYLTLYNGVGDSTTILIDGLDTLQILSEKIENAIINDQEDGGLGMSSGDIVVDQHVADYVDVTTPGTFENQQGSIVIRSPKTDKDGRLYLAASEDLLNALGVSIIQEAENNEMDITVRDAMSGELIGEDTVSDNRLKGVIDGIDLEFDANYNLNVEWDTATRSFDFSATDEVTVETINIVDNSLDFQIGPNEGQMMNAFIAQMDAEALGVDRIQLTDPAPAQESIRLLDEALDLVSAERSRLGAYASRLDYTMANLAAQRENVTAAESRIRDLDVARESTTLAKSQILSQTSTAMLAQANQQAQGLMNLLR